MTVVLLDGRKLPNQDWEGDDFTPGAGGQYVTCTDTAAGRDVAYATNGRKDIDGKVYRAHVKPRDPNGVSLPQARDAVKEVTGLTMKLAGHDLGLWTPDDALDHLRAKKGLVMQLWYAAIPRMYRYQLAADFGHAMWASHYSPTSGTRVWDPLDPNLSHHGQWIPWPFVRDAMLEWQRRCGTRTLLVGYVPLQPLAA